MSSIHKIYLFRPNIDMIDLGFFSKVFGRIKLHKSRNALFLLKKVIAI